MGGVQKEGDLIGERIFDGWIVEKLIQETGITLWMKFTRMTGGLGLVLLKMAKHLPFQIFHDTVAQIWDQCGGNS